MKLKRQNAFSRRFLSLIFFFNSGILIFFYISFYRKEYEYRTLIQMENLPMQHASRTISDWPPSPRSSLI